MRELFWDWRSLHFDQDGFKAGLKDLRHKMLDHYLTLFMRLEMFVDKTVGVEVLKTLVEQRNIGAQDRVDESYFQVDNMQPGEVASRVVEGALDELHWLENLETPSDVETRFHWVCEQDSAVREDSVVKRLGQKQCAIKGRFLVLWTVITRLKMVS